MLCGTRSRGLTPVPVRTSCAPARLPLTMRRRGLVVGLVLLVPVCVFQREQLFLASRMRGSLTGSFTLLAGRGCTSPPGGSAGRSCRDPEHGPCWRATVAARSSPQPDLASCDEDCPCAHGGACRTARCRHCQRKRTPSKRKQHVGEETQRSRARGASWWAQASFPGI